VSALSLATRSCLQRPGSRHTPPGYSHQLPTTEPTAPQRLYHFALSPEDRGEPGCAPHSREDTKRPAIVTRGRLGHRFLAAFKQELEKVAAGGRLRLRWIARDRYRTPFTHVLRINDKQLANRRSSPSWAPSCNRATAASAATSSSISPPWSKRRRSPAFYVHRCVPLSQGKSCRPTRHPTPSNPIRTNNQVSKASCFQNALDVRQDLAERGRNALCRSAYPNGGGPRRNRLFAFGFDALIASPPICKAAGTNIQVEGCRPADTGSRPSASIAAGMRRSTQRRNSGCCPPPALPGGTVRDN